MPSEMKPAYLLSGDDDAKLSAALARLRGRAEREGGPGGLEAFEATGSAGPDVDAIAGSIPAMSLTAERRYLLADTVERWKPTQVETITAALAKMPPDVTVVLISRGAPPKGLAKAVEGAGGEHHAYQAPRKRELPAWLMSAARERGFELAPQAARTLLARLGESTVRLGGELDRLALWAGPGGRVGVEDVEAMVGDDSERAGWALGDAIVARDREAAVGTADELLAQGDAVTPLVYGMASRLRNAHRAASELEAGKPPRDVEAALPMAPYPAKMLVRSVRGTDPAALSEAIGAVADLVWWTRGGSDYSDEVALTIAVGRAAGGS
jgi:DNA polymerase III delta subunit